MRILLITTHLNIGGIPIYTLSLAKALSKAGHRVVVASSGGELLYELNEAGILHINIPINTKSILNPLIFFSALRLHYMLYAICYMPDIIHSQTRVANVVALYLSKFLRIPFISTCHGFFRNNLGRRLFPNWGRCVIAISEAVRQYLISEFKIDEKKIKFISNGIDILRFTKSADEQGRVSYKQQLGIPKDNYCIGVMSRLVKIKGQEYFLKAFARLAGQYPISGLIVGDGESKMDLENLAKDLGVNDKVVFAGKVYPSYKPLSIMDIFVFPSIWREGFGLSILEAMAMGVAVVAFDVGGVSEIIKDGCGILVKPKDIDGLCEALLMLLKDSELRKRMGERGRCLAAARFSIDRTAEDTYKVYEEAIKDIKNYSAA